MNVEVSDIVQVNPEALRLANWLDAEACGGSNWSSTMNAAAAELRRLHVVNENLKRALAESCDEEREQLYEAGPGGGCARSLSAESQRDALLEALKELVGYTNKPGAWDRARAAIKAVEENT